MISRIRPLQAILCVVAAAACSGTSRPAPLTDSERSALADTLRQSVRHAFHAVDSIPCERPDSLLDQTATFDYGPLVYAGDTAVQALSREQALTIMGAAPCPSPVGHAELAQDIAVQVFSRDHALVAWKYAEELREPDDRHQRVQGVVVETKVRTPNGWRSTSRTGSHVNVGAPRKLPE